MNKPLTLSIIVTLTLPVIGTAQNLYLSGGSGGDIYRYTMSGTRTTIATGLAYSGLACDSAGNLFAASPAAREICQEVVYEGLGSGCI